MKPIRFIHPPLSVAVNAGSEGKEHFAGNSRRNEKLKNFEYEEYPREEGQLALISALPIPISAIYSSHFFDDQFIELLPLLGLAGGVLRI